MYKTSHEGGLHLRAPAKVNLCLFVLGRREDGYHVLESLVSPITLFDEIELNADLAPGIGDLKLSVESDCVEAPGGENNLAYRAAAAFAHEASFGGRVEIKLRKNIPVGSGLGGGSSDAATVLVALNALTGKTLSNSNLITIGSRIGADVPLFVVGSAAVIRGIGDIVEQVLLPSQLNLVLCSDRHVLSTKDVFSRVKLSLTTGTQLTRIRKFLNGGAPIPEILHNDLELAASMLHPEITKIKRRLLERGATAALMTGSGSAVFGLCADAESAGTIARYLREEGYWAEAVQTCGPGGGSCDGR